MKFRTDFVTNSSSSSFLICHNTTLTQNQEKLLQEFVKEYSSNDCVKTLEDLKKQAIQIVQNELSDGLQITKEEDLRNIFEQQYQLSECEAVVDRYNYFLKKLQDGKSLTEVCIDQNLLSINLFRDLCQTLNKDEEFDFIDEEEKF